MHVVDPNHPLDDPDRPAPRVSKSRCIEILRDFFGPTARFQTIKDGGHAVGLRVIKMQGFRSIELARFRKRTGALSDAELDELPFFAASSALKAAGMELWRGYEDGRPTVLIKKLGTDVVMREIVRQARQPETVSPESPEDPNKRQDE